MVITAWLVSELMLQVFFSRSVAGFVPPSSPPPGCSGRPVRRSRLLTSLGSGGRGPGREGAWRRGTWTPRPRQQEAATPSLRRV